MVSPASLKNDIYVTPGMKLLCRAFLGVEDGSLFGPYDHAEDFEASSVDDAYAQAHAYADKLDLSVLIIQTLCNGQWHNVWHYHCGTLESFIWPNDKIG